VSADDYTAKVFHDRAVTSDVAEERGYRRYGIADKETVAEVDARLLHTPSDPGWLDRVLTAPGLAMPRPALVPADPAFPAPYAQLRPDWPVNAKPRGHNHKGFRHRKLDDPELAGREGICFCGQRHKRPPLVSAWPEPGKRPDWYERPLSRKELYDHEMKPCDWVWLPPEVVERVPLPPLACDRNGKLLFPTGHIEPRTGRRVVPFEGRHLHLDWAKYVYAPGQGKAARISTHPRVRASGYETPEGLMFLALEGVLKCDAIVSAGWPAIETGSVTLWRSEAEWIEGFGGEDDGPEYVGILNELAEFAHAHLQGVKVAVVCDSDWIVNARVRRQVKQAVALLAECDVEAVGCAPPQGDSLGWVDPRTGLERCAKLGVDDYLARERDEGRDTHPALLEMPVQEPGPDQALDALIAELAAVRGERGRRPRSDGLATLRLLLHELQERGGPAGITEYAATELGEAIGKDRKRVGEARLKLERAGRLVEIVAEQKVWNGPKDVKTIPALVQLAKELRPPVQGRRLGDWLETS
jgi:hypothetical protein